MHLKAHKFVKQGCFFRPLFSYNFYDQLSLNFHRFVVWVEASENTGRCRLHRCPVPLHLSKKKKEKWEHFQACSSFKNHPTKINGRKQNALTMHFV